MKSSSHVNVFIHSSTLTPPPLLQNKLSEEQRGGMRAEPSFNIYFVAIFSALLIHVLQADKVPTTGEIEDYKDPLISEIFSSINSSPNAPVVESPPAVGARPVVGPPPGQYNRIPAGGAGDNGQRYVAMPAPGQETPQPSHGALPSPTSNYRAGSLGIPQQKVEEPTFSNGYAANSGQQQSQLGELAVQGAQNFYTGFQQAGRLLGIDSGQYQQYEVPLVSSAASFFGRK